MRRLGLGLVVRRVLARLRLARRARGREALLLLLRDRRRRRLRLRFLPGTGEEAMVLLRRLEAGMATRLCMETRTATAAVTGMPVRRARALGPSLWRAPAVGLAGSRRRRLRGT
jgi:hypothetical protein